MHLQPPSHQRRKREEKKKTRNRTKKQNTDAATVTQASATQASMAWVARPCGQSGLRNPSCTAQAVRPGSHCLACISISSSSSSLSLSLSFFLRFCCFCILGLLSMNDCNYFWVINRVLETRFPGRCHVEKILHQTWSTHENWVFKTQFIGPKSSLLDSRC